MIPVTENKLKPKTTSNVTECLNVLRETQKIYHGRNTAQATLMNIGDDVLIQRGNRDWVKAKIVGESGNPRSLIVERKMENNIAEIQYTFLLLNQTLKIILPW